MDRRSLLLTGAVAAVFLLFHGTASWLGSDRGQAGLWVGLIVGLATAAAQRLLYRTPLQDISAALGLGRPTAFGIVTALLVSMALLAAVPVFAVATGTSFSPYPGWVGLLPGLFAQAGIAEETLFRGFLFGRLREGRSFWRAAFLSTVPFLAVHLLLFASMSWPVALAAILLAATVSFPLAHLYELGGGTVWAPAWMHFVVQGAIKVAVASGPSASLLPLVWMAAAATIPFLVFLVRRPAT